MSLDNVWLEQSVLAMESSLTIWTPTLIALVVKFKKLLKIQALLNLWILKMAMESMI
jgi:hypothetical protein